MFSGGAGYAFDRMMQDAGIPDYYVIARRPDTDNPDYVQGIPDALMRNRPPFIIPLGAAGQHLCKELEKSTRDKSYKTPLSKYIGSLLSSNRLTYDNYTMPLHGVDTYIADWSERTISTYFDLQKLREEYNFWKKHGVLQPLPFRQLIYQDQSLQALLGFFSRFARSKLLSVDIETCYPKKDSVFYPHPGYTLTVGIADSSSFGISFNLFREDVNETKILWRALADLLYSVPQLGQNYFNFDQNHLSMLGFHIPIKRCQDTLIRHHILWPELPHKLQFQTRQYTREVYYKDDGHRWSLKSMDMLRRYNALDVTVTYEVYDQQESEFKMRPHLL
jgi:hypothetical protein